MPYIEDGSVDMVLCDLPYGVTAQHWDQPLDNDSLWREYHRVCKPNAAICLFASTGFDKVIASSNIKEYKYDWVWHKNMHTGHLLAKKRPLAAHEYVCVFYRKLPKYNPQLEWCPTKLNPVTRRSISAVYGVTERDSLRELSGNQRYPRSVLNIDQVPQNKRHHPNEKPQELLQYLINTYTDPGEMVLDNTMGSGSTVEAALSCGRRCIGIEQDPDIYATAEARLSELLEIEQWLQ